MRGGHPLTVGSQIHIAEESGQLESMKLLGLVGLPKQQESAAGPTCRTTQELLVVKHDAPRRAFDAICNVRLYQFLRFPFEDQGQRFVDGTQRIGRFMKTAAGQILFIRTDGQ